MANFFDTSEWVEKQFFNTKGTRDKCVLMNPHDGCDYFYKTSINNHKGKNFKYEFWSEIIASELGISLGFNVLKYDIAQRFDNVGCISKSMIIEGTQLVEGINILTGYDNTYKPIDKTSYQEYTFDFICDALEYFNLDNFVTDIIGMIVFDAIIGNSDRHQENWGFIVPHGKSLSDQRKKIHHRLLNWMIRQKECEPTNHTVFAPIYDSGCCLAREKDDKKVQMMLDNKIMFNAFINRGQSEIRWLELGKISHFEIIEKLNQKYPDLLNKHIYCAISNYDKDKIRELVFNIDSNMPNSLKQSFGLPTNRKELIIQLIDARINRLRIYL